MKPASETSESGASVLMGTGGDGVTEADGEGEALAFLALAAGDGDMAREAVVRVRLRLLRKRVVGDVVEVVLGWGVVTGCSGRFFLKLECLRYIYLACLVVLILPGACHCASRSIHAPSFHAIFTISSPLRSLTKLSNASSSALDQG